jgi:hypothetical protein
MHNFKSVFKVIVTVCYKPVSLHEVAQQEVLFNSHLVTIL